MILKVLLNTYPIYMGDIYENIEVYYWNKELKILMIVDDMIADTLSDNKL